MSPGPLLGHSLRAEIVPGSGFVSVRCTYGGGAPAKAEVMLVSPADPTQYRHVLQTGADGIARFQPDSPGLWRLVADDGLGHRAKLEFAVDASGSAGAMDSTSSGRAARWSLVVLLGVLAPLGWLWWRRERGRADG